MEEDRIEKYRHDLEFVRNACRQTENDFARLGISIHIDEELSGNWKICCSQLEKIIIDLCNEQRSKLPAILYHIDVPEHKVNPLRACADPGRTAEIILQRELIKVVLKKLYSS